MCGLFAHLSSPPNCKHIILKTALEIQQMSNWRVNYHYVPLISLSTALWHKPELLSDGAVFPAAFFRLPKLAESNHASSSNLNIKEAVNI